MNQSSKPIRMTCPFCDSEEISRDANARWNTETQEWEVSAVYDDMSCDNCDSELKYCNTKDL